MGNTINKELRVKLELELMETYASAMDLDFDDERVIWEALDMAERIEVACNFEGI